MTDLPMARRVDPAGLAARRNMLLPGLARSAAAQTVLSITAIARTIEAERLLAGW